MSTAVHRLLQDAAVAATPPAAHGHFYALMMKMKVNTSEAKVHLAEGRQVPAMGPCLHAQGTGTGTGAAQPRILRCMLVNCMHLVTVHSCLMDDTLLDGSTQKSAP